MSEYIGSRISLISKSDIRYVGTLVEINSEKSTVALEDVRSFGTEGRRSGEDEILPSATPYDYIIFRGSDVKDLRIEEAPKEAKPAPPPVPNDPAILGSARPSSQKQPPQSGPPPHGPGFPQQSPFDQYPPFPPNQAFGRGFPGAPGFGGFPGMPYGGVPPGWYPPPGQAFPPHATFSGQPSQAPGSASQQQQGGKGPGPQPPPQAPGAVQDEKLDTLTHKSQPQDVPPKDPSPAPAPPPPPVESKPNASAVLASAQAAPPQSNKPPTQPKGRVVPVVPLSAKPTGPATTTTATVQVVSKAPGTTQQYQSATEAATAAVAAAMAKLPGRQKQDPSDSMDNLTRKVNEMRTDDNVRYSRQQGTGGYVAGHRGGRGGRRGSFREHANTKPIEIPATDYDFQSANAKFNKQDLAKEVIASASPVSTTEPNDSADTVAANGDALNDAAGRAKVDEDVIVPPAQPVYDKKSSFFDNISSEFKDRDELTGKKVGGQEFRTEERKKNMETFGQGSVDSYRGGYRGRGRRGYRGRGGFGGRGRGGYRGGRGTAQAATIRTGTAAVEASGS